MPKPFRIAHLTTVHLRSDTRIFLKQCRSLAAAGYDVTLIVADGLGDERRDEVRILDIGKPGGRLGRMIGSTRRMRRKAIDIDADLYHFHDPELLPIGRSLKRCGKKVIYDAHEDVPSDMLSKDYLHPAVRKSVAKAIDLYERSAARRLDCVVAATPAIRERFARHGIRALDVNNFPMLGELDANIPWSEKAMEVCYVGGIASTRGIRQVVDAMASSGSGARLNLAGGFPEKEVRAEVEKKPGWPKVNEFGFLSRAQVRDMLARSVAGLVTFLPEPNHINAQPNKMFEYMSAGLPVIASNFPLWREIIEGNDCGICVDPLDPKAIAAAIDELAGNPDKARRMGENGRRAVEQRYNWAVEEKKLLALYEKLLGQT